MGSCEFTDSLDASGISLRVFRERFQLALHRSPKEAILQRTHRAGKIVVGHKNLAVALVAKKSGSGSQEYFARLFHRRTGMTPRTYRNERYLPPNSSTCNSDE